MIGGKPSVGVINFAKPDFFKKRREREMTSKDKISEVITNVK